MHDWEGSSAYVEQGRHWSSALIWLCSVLFGGTLIWAFTARIDQTVTVRGRLEPSGSVRDVESPSAGVVSKVFVKDGQKSNKVSLYLMLKPKVWRVGVKLLKPLCLYLISNQKHSKIY